MAFLLQKYLDIGFLHPLIVHQTSGEDEDAIRCHISLLHPQGSAAAFTSEEVLLELEDRLSGLEGKYSGGS